MAFDATDFRTETVPAPTKPAIDNANLRRVRDLIAGLRTSPSDGSKFDATPAQAVAVLDHLIATGEVDWSVASKAEA